MKTHPEGGVDGAVGALIRRDMRPAWAPVGNKGNSRQAASPLVGDARAHVYRAHG